jgi:hypothetical protein
MLLNFFSSSKISKLECLFLVSYFGRDQYLDKSRNMQGMNNLVFYTNILFG